MSKDHGTSFEELKMPMIQERRLIKAAVSNLNDFVGGMDDGSVFRYRFTSNGFIESDLVTKCPGTVRALAISPTADLICCSGE